MIVDWKAVKQFVILENLSILHLAKSAVKGLGNQRIIDLSARKIKKRKGIHNCIYNEIQSRIHSCTVVEISCPSEIFIFNHTDKWVV